VITSKLSVTKDSNSRLLGDALAKIILLLFITDSTAVLLFDQLPGFFGGAKIPGGTEDPEDGENASISASMSSAEFMNPPDLSVAKIFEDDSVLKGLGLSDLIGVYALAPFEWGFR